MNTTKLNKIPKSWADITVAEYQEINTLDVTKDDFTTHLLSILTDTSIDVIEEFEYDEFISYLNLISFYKNQPKTQPKNQLKILDTDLFLIDFNKLTLGEFIDLEHFFVESPLKNLSTILAICYRKKEVFNSAFELDKFEDYGDYIFHRSPLFYEVSIADVFGIINSYIKFRTRLFDSYEGLFDDSDIDEDIDEDLDVISKAEASKQMNKDKLIKKWGWDMLIYKLSNNDATKVEQVYKLNIIMAFNILSMQKELNL